MTNGAMDCPFRLAASLTLSRYWVACRNAPVGVKKMSRPFSTGTRIPGTSPSGPSSPIAPFMSDRTSASVENQIASRTVTGTVARPSGLVPAT